MRMKGQWSNVVATSLFSVVMSECRLTVPLESYLRLVLWSMRKSEHFSIVYAILQ